MLGFLQKIGTSVEFLAEAMKKRLAKGNPALNSKISSENFEKTNNVDVTFKSEDFEMPVTGEIIPLSEVPDPAFASGMMGSGFGILPKENTFRSPVDGKVMMIFPTKHAMGLVTDTGVEVLIHIGLDTVKLNGEGFELLVEQDQLIQRGDALIKFDLEYVKANAPSIVTPIIFTNSQDKTITLVKTGYQRSGTTNIVNIKNNRYSSKETC